MSWNRIDAQVGMGRIEKTVFISYRRVDASWALAIFQDLTQHGYDVFFDFTGIASGDFETAILENIRARAHFLVLLTRSTLERCDEPEDWLRREIETAVASRRNIVPLMLEGFDFTSPAIASQLSGRLSALKRYNALRIPVDYFSDAMNRLREKFLNVPLDSVLQPASSFAQQIAREHQAAAHSASGLRDTKLGSSLTASIPEQATLEKQTEAEWTKGQTTIADYSDRTGFFAGPARNKTHSIAGKASLDILKIDNSSRTVSARFGFSEGLYSKGTLVGAIDKEYRLELVGIISSFQSGGAFDCRLSCRFIDLDHIQGTYFLEPRAWNFFSIKQDGELDLIRCHKM